MAMFCPNMMRISMELALYNPVYEDMAIKFLSIISTLQKPWKILAKEKMDWNKDGFFYDVLQLNDGTGISLKLRSIVGLIPMFAVK